MADLTSITVTPSVVVKGQTAQVKLGISNPDRVSTITGVDETGKRVTATYDVHENLAVNAVAVSQLPAAPASAPPGLIVLATDGTTDALTPNPADLTAVTLQTN